MKTYFVTVILKLNGLKLMKTRVLKNKKINIKKEYAKRYLLKYIKELKVHFDLTEKEVKDIIRDAYCSKSALYLFFVSLAKYFKEKR